MKTSFQLMTDWLRTWSFVCVIFTVGDPQRFFLLAELPDRNVRNAELVCNLVVYKKEKKKILLCQKSCKCSLNRKMEKMMVIKKTSWIRTFLSVSSTHAIVNFETLVGHSANIHYVSLVALMFWVSRASISKSIISKIVELEAQSSTKFTILIVSHIGC